MTLDDLVAHAEEQGLRVVWRDLGRRSGELTRSGLVVVNHRKSTLTQRVTIAHEVGHHHHGHDWTRAHDVERDERQADMYAARLLIDPVEVEVAAALTGGHPGAMARELGVTAHLVTLWLERPVRATRCAFGA